MALKPIAIRWASPAQHFVTLIKLVIFNFSRFTNLLTRGGEGLAHVL
jgi:hypothetical protein